MSDAAATTVIDCRGELCPLPVLKARRALARRQAIEIWCTDPLAELDLRALCEREGHHFLSATHDTEGVQRMVLRPA